MVSSRHLKLGYEKQIKVMDNGKVYAKCEERALRIYIVRCSMNGLKEQKMKKRMTAFEKKVWKFMEEIGWENAPEGFHLEYFKDVVNSTKKAIDYEKV